MKHKIKSASIDTMNGKPKYKKTKWCKLLLRLSFCCSSLTFSQTVSAQDSLLTFQSAIRLAFENNFGLRIAATDLEQLKNYDNPGQAGMLPDLYLNGAYSKSNTNTRLEYSSGEQVDRDNAISENLTGEVSLGWTIFDGLKMFSTRKKLSEMTAQGEIALKVGMEEVYLQMIRIYYEVSRQQQLLRSIQEEIVLAKERLTIAERRFANGSGAKLEVLHAKTDLNARLSAEITQQSILESFSIELNRVLARAPETPFIVEDSVIISYNPSPADLNKQSEELNNHRAFYRKQLVISELSMKESRSQRMPLLRLNGNYLYSKTENDAGFLLYSKNQGFNYGITASVPLFNGFRISQDVKNAKLDVMTSRLRLEEVDQQIKANLQVAFRNFQDQISILKLEEENINSAKEILMISQERFKSGLSSIIELKVAQRTYEEAMNRLVDARFNAKVAEGYLKQLAGDLIRQ